MTKRKKKFLAVFLCFLITAFCGACTGNGEKLPPDSDDKQIETPSSDDKDEGGGASSGEEESGNGGETPSEDEDGDKTPSGDDNKGGNEGDNDGDKTDGTVIILPTEKF